jgi:hypothetical protein
LVTLNFDCLGIGDEIADRVFSEIRARVSRGWKYQRERGRTIPDFMWVFIHANPDGKRHVHWMVHVPLAFEEEFKALVRERVQKVTGQDDLESALHFQETTNPSRRMKYIAKGVDPFYAAYFHFRRVEDEGVVSGRRIQTSRTLSKAARDRAGWTSKQSAVMAKAA